MRKVLPLFIMVDACGWEIIKNDPFAQSFAPTRKRLSSVFGYSSACVPSILSGRWPVEHRNWCYFVYNPANSPFKSLQCLGWIPRAITSRRIVRRWLSKLVRKQLNFQGYFDLYNIPFKHIGLYDFTEKKSPLKPNGLNQGPNIFDYLEQRRIKYFVSDPARNEEENLSSLIRAIRSEEIEFAFLYWPALDGLLHLVGNDSPQIPIKLRAYEKWIENLLSEARKHCDEIHLYVFSDHGMANCDELLDLKAQINGLNLRVGKDYVAVFDSTMARFWFFNEHARNEISRCLQNVPQGRILDDAELASLHALFPDRYFGEMIFLVQEGVLIVPSDMGERPIRAMHGYHPSEKHSYAALMTNRPEVPEDINAIPDIYRLMVQEVECSRAANANRHISSETTLSINS